MTSPFATLGLGPKLLENLQKLGFTEPTPVQADAIPAIMAGRDLMATAPTGTGKTGAFLLPALERLANEHKSGTGPRMLVLSPTRELAQQTGRAAKSFADGLKRVKAVTITGGESYQTQNRVLGRPYEILIATPGRLIDQHDNERIDLSRVEILVLDEVDRMLDIGFTDAVLQIAASLPANRQTLCFTATLSPEVAAVADKLLRDPHRIDVGGPVHSRTNIEQKIVFVDDIDHKRRLLTHFLAGEADTEPVIVFTATRRDADEIARFLSENQIPAIPLHGDLSQRARNRAMEQLRSGQGRVLVATDVAARGIDISGISHVFNFDLPKFAEDYVHRIGRTGRAGANGIAISFVSRHDLGALRRIERFVGQSIAESRVEGLESRFRPDQEGRPGPRGRRDRQPRGEFRPRKGPERDGRGPSRPPRPHREDRQPFVDEDRQPVFAEDRQPDFNDDRQPRFDDRQPPFGQGHRGPKYPKNRPQGTGGPRGRNAGGTSPRPARNDRRPPAPYAGRQPDFNDDRQPRFGSDDAAKSDAPSYYDEHQPDFNDDRQRYGNTPPKRQAGGHDRGANNRRTNSSPPPANGQHKRQGSKRNGPPAAGPKPRKGGKAATGGQHGKAYGGRKTRQVGLYQPPTAPSRPDWRNERLSDADRKPKKVVKIERKGERKPEGTAAANWTYTGRTLRLKKKDASEE